MKEQTNAIVMEGKKLSIYQLCMMAMMAALMCILGPMSIPIGQVPITFTNLVIYLAVFLLGTKMGTISCLVYLLLGMAGLPVFSGYSGGFAKLAGPTGGYLVGFLFMAAISGIFVERSSRNPVWSGAGMVLGTAVLYLFGTAWFVLMMKCTVVYALAVCVVPFILGDLIKIVLAVILGKQVRRALMRADLIE